MEGNIFLEIKEFEKRADEAVEKANKEKEGILQGARLKASRLIREAEEQAEREKGKKVASFADKLKQANEVKIAEERLRVGQMKKNASKKMGEAVEFVLKKFEEMM